MKVNADKFSITEVPIIDENESQEVDEIKVDPETA